MKNNLKTIRLWSALLLIGLSLAACSVDSKYPQPKTFTMTVSAQKSNNTTRGVLTDGGGSTITAEWAEGESTIPRRLAHWRILPKTMIMPKPL